MKIIHETQSKIALTSAQAGSALHVIFKRNESTKKSLLLLGPQGPTFSSTSSILHGMGPKILHDPFQAWQYLCQTLITTQPLMPICTTSEF